MKVKLTHTMAGPDGTHVAGSVIEVSDEKGAELVKGKYAVKHVEPAAEKDESAADKKAEEVATNAETKTEKKQAEKVKK